MDRLIVHLAALTVCVGFLLPWVDYESPSVLNTLMELPDSQAVAGWRLPSFARELSESWVVGLVGVARDEPFEPSLLWFVYGSPLLALGSAILVGRMGRLTRGGVALAQLGIGAYLLYHAIQGFPDPDTLGFSVAVDRGIWVAVIGHFAAALALQRFRAR